MILAAIGELNGRAAALEAVLRAVDDAGIFTVVQTGNLVGGLGQDSAVLAMLRARGVVVVRGPHDRACVRLQRGGDALARRLPAALHARLQAAHQELAGTSLEFLAGLPEETRFTVDGLAVCVCHGASGNRRDVLCAHTPRVKFERQRELAPVDVFVNGGAPEPYTRRVGGTVFVGPGPVAPAPGRACYALVDTETVPWGVTFPELSYEEQAPAP